MPLIKVMKSQIKLSHHAHADNKNLEKRHFEICSLVTTNQRPDFHLLRFALNDRFNRLDLTLQ